MKDIIISKADIFAHKVYRFTRNFPKEEIYGLTSQLRRAVLSVILNLIEGYARISKKEHVYFLSIAYGSLKETKYLLHFSWREGYLSKDEYAAVIELAEEIGKLIWSKMQNMKHK